MSGKKEKPERKPVVLSKDEALYPPSKRSLIIAGAAGAIAVIVLIVYIATTVL